MSIGKVRKSGIPADGDDRRKHPRYKSMETGTIWYRGIPFACTFHNLSVGGALIEADLSPPEGSRVEVKTAALGRVSAKIVRASNSEIGLKFEQEISFDQAALVPSRAAVA